ncbi:MAG TPA: hypothetical protein VK400_11810 [Pyrinomonadaceae bacterium]|nr:hypothetical protein [Pyrinomonadaceae bacterium]
MAKNNQQFLLNFSNPSPGVVAAVGGLVVFVLFLIGLTIAVATRYIEPPPQFGALVLLALVPVFGLIFATAIILRNVRQLSRSLREDFGDLMLPEAQRRKLNAEVAEIAAVLGIGKEQMGDLRAAYILAEDLALRQIEQEKKLPLKRHVQIGKADFDAVFISSDVSTLVDVMFLVTADVSQKKIDAVLNKVETAKRNFARTKSKAKVRLLLVLVTQIDPEEEARLHASMAAKFRSMSIDLVEVRLLDFEGLQRIFTEE